MDTSVKANIIRIGNSRGIRVPKVLLEHVGLQDEVELEATEGALIIRPVQRVKRKDWAQCFQKMAEHSDDVLQDNSFPDTQWDEETWEW